MNLFTRAAFAATLLSACALAGTIDFSTAPFGAANGNPSYVYQEGANKLTLSGNVCGTLWGVERCFAANLAHEEGNGIGVSWLGLNPEIDNVTIDLRGFKIGGYERLNLTADPALTLNSITISKLLLEEGEIARYRINGGTWVDVAGALDGMITVPFVPALSGVTTIDFKAKDKPFLTHDFLLHSINVAGSFGVEESPVPEPGTWAMLAGGLGAVIFGRLRKR